MWDIYINPLKWKNTAAVTAPPPEMKDRDRWVICSHLPSRRPTVSDLAQKNMLLETVIICGASRERHKHFAKTYENETRGKASVKAIEFQTSKPCFKNFKKKKNLESLLS